MELNIPLGESGQFASSAEYGLYIKALDWCMSQARNNRDELPTEWFVPDSVINAWNERRSAKRLVAHGKWRHDDYRGGYVFVYLYRRNEPGRIRKERIRDRNRHRNPPVLDSNSYRELSEIPPESRWEFGSGDAR